MRPVVLLVRYGEIGLKSRPVRRRFEQALQENIERALEQEGVDGIITRIPGRLLVETQNPGPAQRVLSRVFGLTSLSPARIVASELATLLPEIARYFDELAADRPQARTLALRVRRSGQHTYTSQDVARQGGGAILDRPGMERWKVDLETADIELYVEIRDHQAFLFHERVECPGGLPLGTQGKVVVLLKDLHSLIAAWLMMKRGCTLVPVTFTGPTGNPARARSFLDVLRRWYFRGEIIEVPHEEVPEFPAAAACVLCMRQMIRKADLVARRRKAKAIVTGEAFTSTTADNLTQFAGLAHVPILRPVLGLTPPLLAEFAQRIGLEAGASSRFQEPCPYRVRGRVDDATVLRHEAELGNEVRAFDAARPRAPASVKA